MIWACWRTSGQHFDTFTISQQRLSSLLQWWLFASSCSSRASKAKLPQPPQEESACPRLYCKDSWVWLCAIHRFEPLVCRSVLSSFAWSPKWKATLHPEAAHRRHNYTDLTLLIDRIWSRQSLSPFFAPLLRGTCYESGSGTYYHSDLKKCLANLQSSLIGWSCVLSGPQFPGHLWAGNSKVYSLMNVLVCHKSGSLPLDSISWAHDRWGAL